MSAATVAVITQDFRRLRSLRGLLESAAMPIVAAVLPESGGLDGLRAYLARHAASVLLYDLVPYADAAPGEEVAAQRFFHRVLVQEPTRRFVVLTRSPHTMCAGARPTNLTAVLAADPAPRAIVTAVRSALTQQRRVIGRASGQHRRGLRHRDRDNRTRCETTGQKGAQR